MINPALILQNIIYFAVLSTPADARIDYSHGSCLSLSRPMSANNDMFLPYPRPCLGLSVAAPNKLLANSANSGGISTTFHKSSAQNPIFTGRKWKEGQPQKRGIHDTYKAALHHRLPTHFTLVWPLFNLRRRSVGH